MRRVFSSLILAVVLLLVTAVPFASGWNRAVAPEPPRSQPVAPAAAGSPRLGAEFQISVPGNPDVDHFLPAAAYNDWKKEYLVVWQSRSASGYREIWARRVSRGGQLLATFAVSSSSNGLNCFQPALAYDAVNANYLIAWVQDPGDGIHYEIWGTLITWDGATVWPERKLFSWANRAYWNPSVAWDPIHQEYFVAWNGIDTTNSKANDVSGTRVSTTGVPTGAIVNIEQDQAVLPHAVAVTYNPAMDEYLAVWLHYTAANNVFDIYGRRIRWDGSLPASPYVMHASSSDKDNPAVGAVGPDGYLVAWQEQRGVDWDILFQNLNTAGQPQGTPNSAWTYDNETRPAVACATPGNQCLIAYQRSFNYGNGVYDGTVWGDLVGPSGLILPTFEIAGAMFWDDEAPAVGAQGSGYLVTYEGDSAGDPTVYRHIYGTLLAPYGTFLPLMIR
jgi:hypothetical protein